MSDTPTISSPVMDIHLEHAPNLWTFFASHYNVTFVIGLLFPIIGMALLLGATYYTDPFKGDNKKLKIISRIGLYSAIIGFAMVFITCASSDQVFAHEGNRSNAVEPIKSVLAEDNLVPDCDDPLSTTKNAFLCGGKEKKNNPVKSTTDGKQYILDIDYFNVKSVDANGNAKVVVKYIVRNP